jgi:predicted GNAT family N-acyltransferase
MQKSDLDFCDELRRLAGWNQRREDWMMYLRLAAEGCFIAEMDDRPVGTATTIDYEKKIGWIGMLIVHPSCRGAGVGRQLLARAIEHLQQEKVHTIKLDATPQGEPLYTRMGFCAEGRITRWIAKCAGTSVNHPSPIRQMNAADLTVAVRLDTAAFGASRNDLLREIQKDALRSVIKEINGDVLGFAMLRPGAHASYLGPIISRGEPREVVLATIAQAPPRDVIWDFPVIPGRDPLPQAFGFTAQRVLTRMRLGEKIDTRVEDYWGLVDPACG